MTVVILYLTSPLEQLVRILPWVVTSNKYLPVFNRAPGGKEGGVSFFYCMMVGSIDSFNFTSHTYIILSFPSCYIVSVSG